MEMLLNGKEVAKKIKEDFKLEVDQIKERGITPKLAVVMVGNNEASKVYVKNKSKACDTIGVEFEEFLLEENTTEEELFELIDRLNEDKNINGILVQAPIPKHLDQNKAFRRIKPEKDVDGFNPINVGDLSIGNDCFISCTPYGVMKILEYYNIELEGKNAVVLGRSNIVGKPMVQCLLSKNATVTVCHSRTQNIKEITKNADILIAAIGKAKFVTEDMVKEGAIVIDVGINRLDNGKICGDVDFEAVESKVKAITPVPGGVGPMTIAMLMNNLVKATKLQNNLD